MNETPRCYAALDVAWPATTGDLETLQGLAAAALDDLNPSGIQELESSWRVYFASTGERERAASILVSALKRNGVTVSAVDVLDEDWARRSQAGLLPVRVGRFIVAPPWYASSAAEVGDAQVVSIEPSMGFGTGHHVTTRLCLAAVQELPLAGRSFLDVGTGSGVLAIVAACLGAAPVTAIDTDPDAVESARANLARNGVADRVQLVLGDFRLERGLSAYAVVANLTGGLLVEARQEIVGLVEPGGRLVTSGFTRDEGPQVVRALSAHATPLVSSFSDEWGVAVFKVSVGGSREP